MENLDELFKYIRTHDKTLVFGNLGRRPHVLFDYLTKQFPTFDVVVVSSHYKFPTTQHIKSVDMGEETSKKCDLLIYAEPPINSYFGSKPIHAARMVIFTSHLAFTYDSHFVTVTHFYPTVDKMKELQALKEADEESKYIESAKDRIDFVSVLSIGQSESDINISPGVPAQHLTTTSYMVVNLTNVRSPLVMYLHVWDAFDYMLENIDKVERWMICFPETGAKSYANFVNLNIDRIFCKRFDYLPGLLSKLPFYKSGVVDRNLDTVEKLKFFEMEYVSPKSEEDAFKSCTVYNLDHIGGKPSSSHRSFPSVPMPASTRLRQRPTHYQDFIVTKRRKRARSPSPSNRKRSPSRKRSPIARTSRAHSPIAGSSRARSPVAGSSSSASSSCDTTSSDDEDVPVILQHRFRHKYTTKSRAKPTAANQNVVTFHSNKPFTNDRVPNRACRYLLSHCSKRHLRPEDLKPLSARVYITER